MFLFRSFATHFQNTRSVSIYVICFCGKLLCDCNSKCIAFYPWNVGDCPVLRCFSVRFTGFEFLETRCQFHKVSGLNEFTVWWSTGYVRMLESMFILYDKLERHWPHRNGAAVRYGLGDQSIKNLGRLWLVYTELQGDFCMLQFISVDSRHINP